MGPPLKLLSPSLHLFLGIYEPGVRDERQFVAQKPEIRKWNPTTITIIFIQDKRMRNERINFLPKNKKRKK
jgi:hypothetical protein